MTRIPTGAGGSHARVSAVATTGGSPGGGVGARWGAGWMLAVLLIGSILVACDAGTGPASPTPPTPTSVPPVPSPTVAPRAVPQGLGLSTHLIGATYTEAELQQIAATGFRWIRLDLFWSQVEQVQGQYTFTPYDHLLQSLAAHGLRAIFILDYGNPLYDTGRSPETAAGRQAFAHYAAAAAAHYRGRGVVWELWNEPNGPQFWTPPPDAGAYMALAQVVAPAIRQADPQATLVGPALAGIDADPRAYLTRCLHLGLLDLVDAVSVHAYRPYTDANHGATAPETALADYAAVRTVITQATTTGQPPRPLIETEWGYQEQWLGSEEAQAAYFTRVYLTNLLAGVPLTIWYQWRDGPQDSFGLVTASGQPKRAVAAAQTLTQQLDGFHLVQRQPLAGAQDYAVLFAKGAQQTLVVWTTGADHTATVTDRPEAVPVISLTGTRRMVTPTGGHVLLDLTGSPQYVTLHP